MWIGTLDGLQQYDGLTFTSYVAGLNRKGNTLSNGIINHIDPAADGSVWVSTEMGGHCRIAPQAGKIEIWDERHIPNPENYFDRGIMTVMEHGNTGWMVSRSGLYQWENGELSQRLWPTAKEEGGVIADICPTGSGKMWIGAWDNLWLMEAATMPHGDAPPGTWAPSMHWPFGNRISDLHLDPYGKLWIATWDAHIFRLDTLTLRMDTFALPLGPKGGTISGMVTDAAGNLWIATGSHGLWQLPANGKLPLPYAAHPSMAQSQLPQYLNGLFIDQQQQLWVATEEGLYIAPLQNPVQEVLPHEPQAPGEDAIVFNHVIRLLSGDIVGASYANGLYRLVDGHYQKIALTLPNGQEVMPVFLFEDSRGQIWIGNYAGVYVHDLQNHATRRATELDGWFRKAIFGMAEDADDYLWFAMPLPELVRLDPRTGKTQAYAYPFAPDPDAGCRFTALLRDGQTLWVGTAACGLLRLDLTTGKWAEMDGLSGAEPALLPSPAIEGLYHLGDTLYLALHSHGLGILNLKTQQVSLLSVTEGLPGNRVTGVLRRGIYDWIFTLNGLARLDRNTGKVVAFNHHNGLLAYTYHAEPIWEAGTGKAIAATAEHLVKLNLDALKELSPPPPVQVLTVNVFGKKIALDALPASGLEIPANRNSLSVEFASLDFRAPQSLRYQYRLEGLDTAWVDIGPSRTVRFTQLPGGDYHLWVRAAGAASEWNAASELLQFRVLTPIWKRWWFSLLILGLLALAGWAIYRNRIRQLTAIFAIRTKISRDLHDEIGSSLSSISILSQIALANGGQLSEREKALLEKISLQSKGTLDSLDDIIWTIQPANDKGEKLVDRIRLMANERLGPLGIAYALDASEEANRLTLKADQRWHCLMIVREALNNAAKYAECQQVQIRFGVEGRRITVEVKDDGKGFEIPQDSHRNGLANMEARAKALKGTLRIETAPGKGTRIVLDFGV